MQSCNLCMIDIRLASDHINWYRQASILDCWSWQRWYRCCLYNNILWKLFESDVYIVLCYPNLSLTIDTHTRWCSYTASICKHYLLCESTQLRIGCLNIWRCGEYLEWKNELVGWYVIAGLAIYWQEAFKICYLYRVCKHWIYCWAWIRRCNLYFHCVRK